MSVANMDNVLIMFKEILLFKSTATFKYVQRLTLIVLFIVFQRNFIEELYGQ